jgi:hypothetical protein
LYSFLALNCGVRTAVNITTKLLQLWCYRITAIHSLLPPEWEALTGYYLTVSGICVSCSSCPRTRVLEWCSMLNLNRYINSVLWVLYTTHHTLKPVPTLPR